MVTKIDAGAARSNHGPRKLDGEMPRRTGDLRVLATTYRDAVRLTQLGARAGLVNKLTGIEKAVAKRLYQQVHGRASPPGQQPFTDAWYRGRERRMLHASIVWGLHGEFAKRSMNAARLLIETFECYLAVVITPLLDITRVAFVPQLVAMKVWHALVCDTCSGSYLAPVGILEGDCPGCRCWGRDVRIHPEASNGLDSEFPVGADERPCLDKTTGR